jgi:hypothetical protein
VCEGYDLITAPRHRNLRDHSLVSALLKRLAYSGTPRTRRKVRLVAELSVYSDQSLDRNYVWLSNRHLRVSSFRISIRRNRLTKI